eukprot:CAMPEP_0202971044 /NCGR_PEP_ID=MMETSP1396-20130829/23201_1 /ASSEMBLY_ACC=CAM_ASM_000872 /TAXON_ID= /ORGANISM="Pseudokeronopsis sp., Strain Brazil" /LENGTH=73 /DNA_ID=CAMNT_0049700011 /DNA_START=106 /DNA_END=327 /DNA_ORIENTATION=+
MGTHNTKPESFKPKTFKEAWLSDTGAYPVMGVIVFAGAFCAAWSGYTLLTNVDARLNKTDRKAPLRGEHKTER